MSKFCKDCFIKLNPEFSEQDLKTCKEETLCEGCGKIVPAIVIGIRERSLWRIHWHREKENKRKGKNNT